MSFVKLVKLSKNNTNRLYFHVSSCYQQLNTKEEIPDTEFKPLNLKHVKGQIAPRRKYKKADVLPPRSKQMAVDQDWGSVWPGPKTFHPAVVPLPVHQGYVEKGASPDKYANLELMKIPNFLHLIPPVIKRQCESLKQFCTSWPAGLENDEQCEKHFPLEVISSTYCHSSPTVRDPLSRIVTIKVKLSELQLDVHAKDKMLRLVGEKYNQETDILTIVTDRCPTSKQNYDYAMYLLTALYYESCKVESWEKTKSEADMEYYDWSKSVSCTNISELHAWNKTNDTEKTLVQKYENVINKLWNEGENLQLINNYNDTVRRLLNVPML